METERYVPQFEAVSSPYVSLTSRLHSVKQTEHDRDVNAAANIRKRGLLWLEKEFAAAGEARADEAAVNEGRPSGLTEAGHGLPAVGIPVL